MIIYYNPECSKCREAMDILKENKCEIEIREYLKDPPTTKELKELLEKLGCKAGDLVRRSESLYTEKFAGKALTNTQWVKVLCENPILIERPIVIDAKRALIGRPPVMVLDLIRKNKESTI
jgi:arsenate reductase